MNSFACKTELVKGRVWLRITFFYLFCKASFLQSNASLKTFQIFYFLIILSIIIPPNGKLLLIDSKLHLILLGSLFIERIALWWHWQESRSQSAQPKENKLLELPNDCHFHAGPSCVAFWRMQKIGVFGADNGGLPGSVESSPLQENNLLSPLD